MSGVTITDEQPVRILAINRPHRRNALTPEVAEQLTAAIEQAGADTRIGALVLTGEGGHFSAGGDADAIVEVIDAAAADAALRLMRTMHHLVEAVWTAELPVVAAVAGCAYGGAFNLALACDLVVCSADARFCQVFLRRGLIPDMGGAYLLPRLVGLQRAKELMLLTGEIDAWRAGELGLVNAVLPDAESARAHAVALAARLAEGPRTATALAKRLLNASTTGTLQSCLELEALTQAMALRDPAARAGFQDFRTRRTPS